MSQMEIDRVLAQIRALSSQVKTESAPASATSGSSPVGEFARLMKDGIERVNQTQQQAGALADAFQRGVPGVELPQVMLEMQKASVSFRALTEVRNRLVQAYQEIMNMPI